jgi:hypothetical protein
VGRGTVIEDEMCLPWRGPTRAKAGPEYATDPGLVATLCGRTIGRKMWALQTAALQVAVVRHPPALAIGRGST